MSIELRTMRYVIAIAECGGFERAAERLHMSQPPLSRQIRELERELGVALFHRRPTRLTAEGHVFVQWARAITADVDRAVAETRAASGHLVGEVRLGCGPMSRSTDVPDLVAAVIEQHPGLSVEAVESWDTELASALRSGDIDLALGWHLPTGPDVVSRDLRADPYVVVVAESHRLTRRDAVALRDLRGDTFRFLARRFAPDYHDAILAAIRSTGEDFDVWENPSPGLRYFGDLTSGGFHVLPRSITRSLPAGVRALPITDELPPAVLRIAWRAGARRSVEAVASVATRRLR
jgi:DNA-binding transcriptional LysR family regulator